MLIHNCKGAGLDGGGGYGLEGWRRRKRSGRGCEVGEGSLVAIAAAGGKGHEAGRAPPPAQRPRRQPASPEPPPPDSPDPTFILTTCSASGGVIR